MFKISCEKGCQTPATEQENQYPLFIKLHEVSADSGNIIQAFFD